MPVISFATSKGGAGKTSSSIILGTTLCEGADVVLVDADPAARLIRWSKRAPLPPRLSVLQSRGEKHIQDEIAEARARAAFVIVDLEGTASRLNAFVVAESDLVVVPMGDEQQDADDAIETLAMLRQEGRALRRDIPAAVLFCRTKAAVKSRLERAINEQIRGGVTSYSVELKTRTAFSALHNVGGTLRDMDPTDVSGVSKAIENAQAFAAETIDLLEGVRNAEPA